MAGYRLIVEVSTVAGKATRTALDFDSRAEAMRAGRLAALAPRGPDVAQAVVEVCCGQDVALYSRVQGGDAWRVVMDCGHAGVQVHGFATEAAAMDYVRADPWRMARCCAVAVARRPRRELFMNAAQWRHGAFMSAPLGCSHTYTAQVPAGSRADDAMFTNTYLY